MLVQLRFTVYEAGSDDFIFQLQLRQEAPVLRSTVTVLHPSHSFRLAWSGASTLTFSSLMVRLLEASSDDEGISAEKSILGKMKESTQ